jgi:enterochelin esterase-like enzyme
MKIILLQFSIFFLFTLLNAQSTLPKVTHGKIIRIDTLQSAYVTSRTIDIWLPENYSEKTTYAVLYMHDGQMLFDADQTWNKQAWEIDEKAHSLSSSKEIKPFIVVGIWNGGQTRHADYFPQKPFDQLSAVEKDTVSAQLKRAGRVNSDFLPQSDNYLRFIVKELKPYVDSHFSVHTDASNTFISGSSMGGLISLYALCEYPEIFGGAACLSTHWIGTFENANNPIPQAFIDYFGSHLPQPNNHRVYFDCGDQTLDAFYPIWQKKMDKKMKKKGFTSNNWKTIYFPGQDHSENAWKSRVNIPLNFLFNAK